MDLTHENVRNLKEYFTDDFQFMMHTSPPWLEPPRAPIMVEEIGKVVQDINSEGTSTLLVEQNAGLALGLAQRVYLGV